jgi:hypothetical protein
MMHQEVLKTDEPLESWLSEIELTISLCAPLETFYDTFSKIIMSLSEQQKGAAGQEWVPVLMNPGLACLCLFPHNNVCWVESTK